MILLTGRSEGETVWNVHVVGIKRFCRVTLSTIFVVSTKQTGQSTNPSLHKLKQMICDYTVTSQIHLQQYWIRNTLNLIRAESY